MKSLQIYNSIVNKLQLNDGNSTYNEVFLSEEGDLIKSIDTLKDCFIQRIEESTDHEEEKFYKVFLDKVIQIKVTEYEIITLAKLKVDLEAMADMEEISIQETAKDMLEFANLNQDERDYLKAIN